MSKSNGVYDNCQDWMQEGSVLLLRIGKDLIVPRLYPGAHNTFNCQANVTFGNHKNTTCITPAELRAAFGQNDTTDLSDSSLLGNIEYEAHIAYLTPAQLQLAKKASLPTTGWWKSPMTRIKLTFLAP